MPNTQAHDEPRADALDRWLAAERSGLASDGVAEAAFGELLHGLPRPAPLDGFADRVLARTTRQAAGARDGRRVRRGGRRRWLSVPSWARVPAAAVLALATLLGLLAARPGFLLPLRHLPPAAVRSVLRAADVAGLLDAVIRAAEAFGGWLAATVMLANQLLLLLKAVVEPLATLPVAVLAAGCLLVSAVALRCLVDLIQRDRRWVYADPI